MKALTALLLSGTAVAQISISTVDVRGAETVVNELHDVGISHPGDYLDTRFRLRNTAAATVTLQALRVSGAGFSMLGNPPLPYLMAPGTNVDIRIRFLSAGPGSYSGALVVNDRTVLLKGLSPPGVAVLVERNGAAEPLSTARAVEFPRVETGEEAALRLWLRNDGNWAQSVNRIAVTGAGFAGPSGLGVPLRLEPGEAAPFEIRFAPSRPGILQGALDVDGRIFALEGVALDPAFPEARIAVDSALTSGRQGKVAVRLVSAARSSGLATLALEFRPAIEPARDDPAVQFLSNASRLVQLPVTRGETDLPEVAFQTGTTAGTIVFRLELGTQVQQSSVTIPATPVSIDTARAWRQDGGAQVELLGFDNTRTATLVAFVFFNRNGQPLGGEGGSIRAEAGEAFSRYFRESSLGGVFRLRASFPVAGDISLIGGVEVELVNSAGSARTARLVF